MVFYILLLKVEVQRGWNDADERKTNRNRRSTVEEIVVTSAQRIWFVQRRKRLICSSPRSLFRSTTRWQTETGRRDSFSSFSSRQLNFPYRETKHKATTIFSFFPLSSLLFSRLLALISRYDMTMNGLPKDRTEILNLINEWNSTRLDLFKISEPNEVNSSRRLDRAEHFLRLAFGILWRDEILFPRRRRQSDDEMHSGLQHGDFVGRHSRADGKITARYENVAEWKRFLHLRSSSERRSVETKTKGKPSSHRCCLQRVENWRWTKSRCGFSCSGEKINVKVDLFYKTPNYRRFVQWENGSPSNVGAWILLTGIETDWWKFQRTTIIETWIKEEEKTGESAFEGFLCSEWEFFSLFSSPLKETRHRWKWRSIIDGDAHGHCRIVV